MKRTVSRMEGISSFLNTRKLAYLLVAPTVVIFAAITLYPLLYSLHLSFFSWNLLRPSLGKVFIGLENYRRIVYDPVFWYSLKTTLYFMGASVALQFLIGLGLALLFNVEFKGRSVARSIILVPLLITPIVIGLMWKWLLNPEFGILNYFLSFVGVSSKSWLGDPSLALFTVIIVDVWHLTPFATLVLLAGLQALPEPLYEAARIDGASWWKMFRYITLPLLKPVILVVLLLRTIGTFATFPEIYALTQGGPGRATEVLGFLVYRTSFKEFRMGYGAALSYVMVVLVLVIALFYIKALPELEV